VALARWTKYGPAERGSDSEKGELPQLADMRNACLPAFRFMIYFVSEVCRTNYSCGFLSDKHTQGWTSRCRTCIAW
jgi:hypothetical protein